MVMLMKGRNSRERLSQSDGRTTRAAAGSLTHSANHGTMKLQHQRSVTNADDDLAQLRVCKRLTRRASLSAALLLRCNFWLPPSLSLLYSVLGCLCRSDDGEPGRSSRPSSGPVTLDF